MLKTTLIHERRGHSRNKIWSVWTEGDTVHVEWGLAEGKLQHTSDKKTAKFVGKKNEVSAEVQAKLEAERLIKKKKEEGYREPLSPSAFFADEDGTPDWPWRWDNKLPTNLRFYKPQHSLPQKMPKKYTTTLKRNGMFCAACIHDGGHIELYSMTMKPVTEHLPHVVSVLTEAYNKKLIPVRSILLGELVCNHGIHYSGEFNDKLNFKYVSTVLRSLPERAIAIQNWNRDWELPPDMQRADPNILQRFGESLKLVCFDIGFWNGEPIVSETPHSTRLRLLSERLASLLQHRVVYGVTTYDDLEYGINVCQQADGVEGLVVFGDTPFGDKAWNLRGKNDRPGCWKWKPNQEDDFVAKFDPDNGMGKWGTGKHAGGVGAVALYQWTPGMTRRLTYICDCGAGLSDEERMAIKPGDELVVEVEFESRTYKSKGAKTNALTFPRIVRIREDKDREHCINEEL